MQEDDGPTVSDYTQLDTGVPVLFQHDFGSKLARIYTPFQQTRLSSFHMLRNAGGMQGSYRLRARQALTGIISLRVKNAFTVKGLAHGG